MYQTIMNNAGKMHLIAANSTNILKTNVSNMSHS